MDGVHYMYNFTEQLWQAIRASRLEWIFRSFSQSERGWARAFGAPSDSAAAHWHTKRSVPFRCGEIIFVSFASLSRYTLSALSPLRNQQISKRVLLFTSYFLHEFRYIHIESIQKQLPICWCFKSPFVPSNFPFIFKRTSHCPWLRLLTTIQTIYSIFASARRTSSNIYCMIQSNMSGLFSLHASLPSSSFLLALLRFVGVCISDSIQPLSLRLRLRLSEGISISVAPNFPPNKQNARGPI